MRLTYLFLLVNLSATALAAEYSTHEGFNIESSCLVKYSEKFPEMIKTGIEKGMTCLKELRGEGSEKNLSLLQDLLKQRVTIGCHEVDYFTSKKWSFAHASASSKNDRPELGLHHPFLSFNSNNGLNKEITPDFLGQISFHEIFHNVGYIHGLKEEYAYACEECCFGNADYKAIACKICKSEYNGPEDTSYIKDLVSYYQKSDFAKYFNPEVIVRIGLFKNPNSLVHFEYLLYLDNSKTPLSVASAKEWLKETTSSYLLKVSQNPTNDNPAFVSFIEQTVQARKTIFKQKNLSKAAEMYINMDLMPLRRYFASDKAMALSLKKSLIADLNVIYDYIGKDYDYLPLNVRYDEIKALE